MGIFSFKVEYPGDDHPYETNDPKRVERYKEIKEQKHPHLKGTSKVTHRSERGK